ncbi:MAG: hypothetical protein ACLP8S_21630 [Solirubrobacteraceae bacterium]
MAAWLIAAIERLPPRVRRAGVATTAVLLLGGAITSLTLEATTGGASRRSTPTVHAPARRAPARPLPPGAPPPVSRADLRLADGLARRFLVSYLQFAYGRGSAGSVNGVTPGLRSQLIAQRAQATPAERGRHPRAVSLATIGTTPGFVVATATIEDGGITAYRLRFTLQEQADRWLVSSVQEG